MNPILIDLPMPIITPRLLIRPPKISDSPSVNEAILESFETLHRYMAWANQKPSLEDTEIYIRQAVANWILRNNDEPYLPLFMFEKETNTFIGATGYHHMSWDIPSLETGYWIRDSFSGKGLMTEAINALTRYAFEQVAVTRISITCDVDNLRSQKVAERLGYVLEGILKSNRRHPITNDISSTMVYAKYDTNNLPHLIVEWGNHEPI